VKSKVVKSKVGKGGKGRRSKTSARCLCHVDRNRINETRINNPRVFSLWSGRDMAAAGGKDMNEK